MIKELALSAALVAILASLPYLFSPIQVAIGSFSDRHPVWGFRRTPYILLGLLFCVCGVIFSPLAAFLLSSNPTAGIFIALLAFGAWGFGFNFASVSYMSLASELSGEKGRSRTIAVMFFIMIVGIILTALAISQMVDPYTPAALLRAFLTIGLTALVLGLLGLVRLEGRDTDFQTQAEELSWAAMFQTVRSNRQATLFFWYLVILLIAILGQDILLEPYAAEAFGFTVRETTRITALWGISMLVALLTGGALEGRLPKKTIAALGAWTALAGFGLIIMSSFGPDRSLLYLGVVVLGAGTGLSTVSNLAIMLDMTTAGSVGLFIGTWGMATAFSRLVGSIMGGVVRDVITRATQAPLSGYIVVFTVEALLLLVSLIMLRRIDVHEFQHQAGKTKFIESSAMAGDI